MIKIAPQTGDVLWGEYTLRARLTHDEFTNLYPHLTPAHSHHGLGVMCIDYDLPHQMIEDQTCALQVSFANGYISSLRIDQINPSNYDEGEDGRWWRAQLVWIHAAHKLLRSQFGEPNHTRPAELFDEATLFSSEFAKQLENWSYTFKWGEVIFWHEFSDFTDYICLRYDWFTQISSWDELVAECERRIENTRIFNVRNLDLMVEMRHLVDVIRHDFDFQTVKPTFGSDGLGFWLPKQKVWTLVSIFPEKGERKYHLGRGDTFFQADVDEADLVEMLRLFIESEKLAP